MKTKQKIKKDVSIKKGKILKKKKKESLNNIFSVIGDDKDNNLQEGEEESDDEICDSSNRGSIKITPLLIEKWSKELHNKRCLNTFLEVSKALLAAVESVEIDANNSMPKSIYKVDDPSIFNSIIRLCLTDVYPALSKILQLKNMNDDPRKSKKFEKTKSFIRPYLKCLIRLMQILSEPHSVEAVLQKGILPILEYYGGHPSACRKLLLHLFQLWGTSEKHIRVLSFIGIFRLINITKKEWLDWILKNCQYISPSNWNMINFMKISLVELYCLDQAVAYRHGFIYIRQMALHLRSVLRIPKKVAVGVLKFHNSSRYFPLMFHITDILSDLSARTKKFIPILPFLLQVFISPTMKNIPKKKSLKPFDWACMLRLSKSQMTESAFYDGAIENACVGVLKYLNVECSSVGFPELVVPISYQLKKYLKTCKVPIYSKQIKQLLEKIKENSDFIENNRKSVSFSLQDTKAVSDWEIHIRQSSPPISVYYSVIKAAQEKKNNPIQNTTLDRELKFEHEEKADNRE